VIEVVNAMTQIVYVIGDRIGHGRNDMRGRKETIRQQLLLRPMRRDATRRPSPASPPTCSDDREDNDDDDAFASN